MSKTTDFYKSTIRNDEGVLFPKSVTRLPPAERSKELREIFTSAAMGATAAPLGSARSVRAVHPVAFSRAKRLYSDLFNPQSPHPIEKLEQLHKIAENLGIPLFKGAKKNILKNIDEIFSEIMAARRPSRPVGDIPKMLK